MPKVPRDFVNNPKIAMVLHHTINEFDFEEQDVIHLYGVVKLPVREIITLTNFTPSRVISILTLYSERLASKLSVFRKAIPYGTADSVSVAEILELEKSVV